MSKQVIAKPSSTAGLDAWLSYLEALHPTEIDMGLARVQAVAERLGTEPGRAKVMTVAGTNGKGSTVRYLETILRASGYTTGAYISPHLQHYEERVRINAKQLDASQHVAAFQAVEAARGETSLTYFEFGTLAAFWLLQQSDVDVWVLEIGLGGRLDAVNCIAADVAMITSVGIDHIGFLGADRSGIAREKAGVFRSQRAAVIGEPNFPALVLAELQQQDIFPQRVGVDFSYRLSDDQQGWHFFSPRSELHQLPLPQLPLPNAATALMALELLDLPVPVQAIREGLVTAREPGRLQYHAGPPEVLIDVAHNPQAATFVAGHIQHRFAGRPVYAVVGMLKDKDITGTLQALAPVVSQWFLADLQGHRAASAAELAEALASAVDVTPQCFASVADAFVAAKAQATDDSQQPLVLVCGSFYTVGKLPQSE